MFNPVDQVQRAPNTTENYGFVSTRKVLDIYEAKGWTVDSIQTSKVKTLDRDGYQKHLVWLKNAAFPSVPGLSTDNNSAPRLCIVNAHDGTSSILTFFGLLRIACLNQLSTGNVFRFFRAVHSKNIVNRIDQGIEYMVDGLPELFESVQRLQNTETTLDQRIQYAKTMVDLRLENVNNIVSVDYDAVNRAVRLEDTKQDAYTVLNRIQEKVIRGGIPYSYVREIKNDDGVIVDAKLIHTTTRKIASIPSQLKLNKVLYENISAIAA